MSQNFLKGGEFTAPTAAPVFSRTYSRMKGGGSRESWGEAVDRCLFGEESGLAAIGELSDEESALIQDQLLSGKALTSGRALWVAGTEWAKKPENFSGLFNCTSIRFAPSPHDSSPWGSFWHLMNLGMMGSGVGIVVEKHLINQLPKIKNRLKVQTTEIGKYYQEGENEKTWIRRSQEAVTVTVGDSRKGWADAYQALFDLSSDIDSVPETIIFDLNFIRPAGEKLKGFGGVANPFKLNTLFDRCTEVLNHAVGRKLYPLEVVVLAGLGADAVVSGNIRRFAGMVQMSSDDTTKIPWIGTSMTEAKLNLWSVDSEGNWFINPQLDMLRVANHTRVFHHRPTKEECIDAVRSQFQSGEGAIQWAGEAIARSSPDAIGTGGTKPFIDAYVEGRGFEWMQSARPDESTEEIKERMERYGLNPCAEVLSGDGFHCNLSTVPLNLQDPFDREGLEKAFKAAALSGAALLNKEFAVRRYQNARSHDPIVLVSFTGFFDFCVKAFGVQWLQWWEAGRPENWGQIKDLVTKEGDPDRAIIFDCSSMSDYFSLSEALFLQEWRQIVERTIWDYCDRHNLKRPSRCTGIKPEGTLSLLSGASPGWHPPKAARFIRRITFRKDDPVALACIDYGYNVVPSQSDKDGDGRLLDDPFDPRCTEWLVEIPVEVDWANEPGADQIDIEKFSAIAQFNFWLQVQQHYTTFNTSATIELTEDEIEPLGTRIYEAIRDNEGYMSSALLPRLDAPFPRLPFEKIDKEDYDRLQKEVIERRTISSFTEALKRHDDGEIIEPGPVGCDSDKCLLPETKGKN